MRVVVALVFRGIGKSFQVKDKGLCMVFLNAEHPLLLWISEAQQPYSWLPPVLYELQYDFKFLTQLVSLVPLGKFE